MCHLYNDGTPCAHVPYARYNIKKRFLSRQAGFEEDLLDAA